MTHRRTSHCRTGHVASRGGKCGLSDKPIFPQPPCLSKQHKHNEEPEAHASGACLLHHEFYVHDSFVFSHAWMLLTIASATSRSACAHAGLVGVLRLAIDAGARALLFSLLRSLAVGGSTFVLQQKNQSVTIKWRRSGSSWRQG